MRRRRLEAEPGQGAGNGPAPHGSVPHGPTPHCPIPHGPIPHGPTPHYRRWVCDASRRYYETRITQGLWGDWHVLRFWGGLGTPLGAQRSELAADLDDALAIVERTARRRARRGYRTA